jgi:hypothetical protein
MEVEVQFLGLNVGQTYRVTHFVPQGYKKTTDDSRPMTVNAGENIHNFGIVPQQQAPQFSTGTYKLDFTCVTGCNFSGTGFYNTESSYTWNITGNVGGSNLTFQIVYTGSSAGYTINGTGTITGSNSLSGNATSPSQSFSWQATKQ